MSVEVLYTTVAQLDFNSVQKAEEGAKKLHAITERKEACVKAIFQTLREREQWEKYLTVLKAKNIFYISELKTEEKQPVILSMRLQTKLKEFGSDARMISAKVKEDGTHFTFCFSDCSKRLAWEEMVETL